MYGPDSYEYEPVPDMNCYHSWDNIGKPFQPWEGDCPSTVPFQQKQKCNMCGGFRVITVMRRLDVCVLDLDYWMKLKNKDCFIIKSFKDCGYTEIAPVFNRPGLYYLRKENKCWAEIHNGRAFQSATPESFLNNLSDFELFNQYDNQKITALKEAVRLKVCTKDQRNTVYRYEFLRGLKRSQVKNRIRMASYLKKDVDK